MEIQYRATGHIRDVSETVGKNLCRSRIADQVYKTRDMKPEAIARTAPEPTLIAAAEPQDAAPENTGAEISERTGRPKRTYRRRDMTAEE